MLDNLLELIEKMVGDKKEYRAMMARVDSMPHEYAYVFRKIQSYMWGFAYGDGMDMLRVQYELIELFEAGVAEGKTILEITGEDIAGFADGLLANTKTYVENQRSKLNKDVLAKIKK